MTSSPRAATLVIALATAIPIANASKDEEASFVPVTDAMLADPPAQDWLTWRRTADAWGYSPLDTITPENVASLVAGLDTSPTPGQPDRDAAGVRRRDVHAESQRRDPSPRRDDGRL